MYLYICVHEICLYAHATHTCRACTHTHTYMYVHRSLRTCTHRYLRYAVTHDRLKFFFSFRRWLLLVPWVTDNTMEQSTSMMSPMVTTQSYKVLRVQLPLLLIFMKVSINWNHISQGHLISPCCTCTYCFSVHVRTCFWTYASAA